VIDGAREAVPLPEHSETLVLITTELQAVAAAMAVHAHAHVIDVAPLPWDGTSSSTRVRVRVRVLSVEAPRASGSSDHREVGRLGLMSPAQDSESTVWFTLTELMFTVVSMAFLLKAWENGSSYPDAPWFDFRSDGAWWAILASFMPYMTGIVLSPANEPLVRAVAELCLYWWGGLSVMNLIIAWAIYRTGSDWIYHPMWASVVSEIPVALWVVFHVSCAIVFAVSVVRIAPMLKARSDAPPFWQTYFATRREFLKERGPLFGRLLLLPNSLPTSTFGYHLAVSHYYDVPVSEAYLQMWVLVRFLQVAHASLFLVHYTVCCVITHGRAAPPITWMLACALINVALTYYCEPHRRRRIRAMLFPHQSQPPRPGAEVVRA